MQFRGAFTALVTPFRRDGALDLPALDRLVDLQIAGGIDGIVPCGTTGEAATLDRAERFQVVQRIVRRTRGRVPVIAGTGTNCTRTTVELCRDARRAGADAVLVVTPYYNKPTPAGMLRHYRRVAAAAGLPVVLYNVPSRTSVNLTPETVAALAKVPGIAATKEAGGIAQADRVLASCALPVLSGDDASTLPLMALGAVGVISVVSNLVPADVKALVSAAEGGDWERARAFHRRLLPLSEACFWETSPGPVKAMLGMLGRCRAGLREPLVEPDAAMRTRLRGALRAYGLR